MKSARPLTAAVWSGGRSVGDPRLSPGGSEIAFTTTIDSRTELALITATGGAERWLPIEPGIQRGAASYQWLPDGSGIVYIGRDGRIHVFDVASLQTRALTRWPDSLSALSVSPDGTRVAYVIDTRDLAIVDIDSRDGWPRRLSSDADFVFDPTWSPDSQFVAWHEWDVPCMPWDGGRIVVRRADGEGPIVTVAGDGETSVQQPRFSPDGKTLSFLSDANGWLNLWAVDVPTFDNARALVAESFEHGSPAWGPGQRSYCWRADSSGIVFVRNERGWGRLCVHDLATRSTRVAHADTTLTGLSISENGRVVGVGSGPRRAQTITVVDLVTCAVTDVARGSLEGIESRSVDAEAVEWQADDGDVVHGRLYRSPASVAESSGAPPLLLWLHGGPAGQSMATLYPRWGYFLERGWSVLVVDYRGSTGWGRDYAQRLRGRWADIDVSDAATAARIASARGWGDPQRMVAYGGSSAGTTVLRLLSDHGELFAAGIALYPLVDFDDFEHQTWRFEAHYMERLIGPPDSSAADRVDRSPMNRIDSITKPLLLLHGDADVVVPVGKTRVLADRLERKGVIVECQIYAGEGHGWRTIETQVDELERIEAFLRRHVVRCNEETRENR